MIIQLIFSLHLPKRIACVFNAVCEISLIIDSSSSFSSAEQVGDLSLEVTPHMCTGAQPEGRGLCCPEVCVGTNWCPAAVSGVSPPAGWCLPLQMLCDCTNEHILIPPRLISCCPSALHTQLGEPSPVLPQLLCPPSLCHQHHLCSFLRELLTPGATSSPPQVLPVCSSWDGDSSSSLH